MLPVLLPVFWAGFNLALMPASLAVKRLGALPVMAGGVLVAAACSAGAGDGDAMGLGPRPAFRLECGTAVGPLVAQPQRLIH